MGRLTVTRNSGESILIGEDILVTVSSSTRGGGIKVTIQAPRDIPIVRTELLGAAQ
ncbi:MAG: carbon storage regulator [Mycolicibacterium frederiksbergense]|nr:carbon storage regulator [Mycolicibacterium frederiksbergense]